MTTANKIPRVLFQPNGNSLSIERVLKMARELLNEIPINDDKVLEEKIIICQDDLIVMLRNLD